METHLWIPSLFAAIAMVYGGLALAGMLNKGRGGGPAQKAHWRIALIFAAVSLFLFFYL